MISLEDLSVRTLGPCQIASPMLSFLETRQISVHNVAEHDRVIFDDCLSAMLARECAMDKIPAFAPAGPRKKIFFDPSKTRAGIVTCGGLCPGLNDVIRGIVMELYFRYGVKRIHGFQNGFEGFIARHGRDVVDLTPDRVSGISEDGGTILGTSRGAQDPQEIVDCLERMNIQMLFVIGGDGSMKGALKIAEAVHERGLRIGVIGIPKTIDNDIPYIDQSFGFQTAFSMATESIRAAHVEAKSSPNGLGIVKTDGAGHSGFHCFATHHSPRTMPTLSSSPKCRFNLRGSKVSTNSSKIAFSNAAMRSSLSPKAQGRSSSIKVQPKPMPRAISSWPTLASF